MKPGLSGSWHHEDHFEYQQAYVLLKNEKVFQKLFLSETPILSRILILRVPQVIEHI